MPVAPTPLPPDPHASRLPHDAPDARDPFTPYQGPGWRQRLRVAALAALVALGILWMVLERPGAVLPKKQLPPDVAACASGPSPGQAGSPLNTTTSAQPGCVGSMTTVLPASGPPSPPK